jgi:hypothetical protein
LLKCHLVTKLKLQLKNLTVQTWVVVHSLLTKLVQWSHVLVDSAAAAAVVAVAAIAVETVVDAVVSVVAVVAIAVETVVETVGNLKLINPNTRPEQSGLFFYQK